MTVVRVAVIADYLEEGWPSMDLVADMLMDRFEGGTAGVAALYAGITITITGFFSLMA